MNHKMIRYTLGWILVFEAIFLMLPAITAFIYGEDTFIAFLLTALICLSAGGLSVLFKPENKTLYSREGYVIVALSWIVMGLFGALPFCISNAIPSYIDAFFEIVSGFTTTGSSVLTNVAAQPKSILMWRGFSNWIGGMGVLVFIMAFLSLSGGNNLHLMRAESTGPAVSKLVPRIKQTAILLYSIYFALTVAEFIILLFAGMDAFEAINTAFSTAGTGGFGIKNDSMNSFTPFAQWTVTIFMLLFSLNFNAYYLIMCRKFKAAFNNEIRVFFALVFISAAIIAVNIYRMFPSVGETIRHSAFAVSSIISSTGFATVDFDKWPELSRTILVLLMFVGACAGSTGGGMKVSRIVILVKSIKMTLTSIIHPKRVQKITIDSHPIEKTVIDSVTGYMACYAVIFVASLLIISLNGYSFTTNFTAVTTALNNIGPGLELIGPTGNFAFLSPLSKLVLIFDMIAGRLEIFPLLLLLSPITWKK